MTSNLASGLKLPYFIPLGLSSDLLITPISRLKLRLWSIVTEERKGELTVNGAFSDDDLASNNIRYFSQLVGNFQLGYGIDLNFNVGKVGDPLIWEIMFTLKRVSSIQKFP